MTAANETGQILPAALAGMTIVKKPYDVVQLKNAILDIVKSG
jgi:hypothetical protein